MPHVDLGGFHIHYALDGDPDKPVLALSNSLGTSLHMWNAILPALTRRFRVLRYDTRGHGDSSVSTGPYTIPQLAGDLIQLMDALRIDAFHFCGISMGGMTGIWLGIHNPDRIKSLILSNTAARIGTRDGWNDRIRNVQQQGLAAMADSILERWFTPEFRAEHPDKIDGMREVLAATAPEGYAGCCAAIRDTDISAELSRIRTPSLIIAGALDPVIPTADSQNLHKMIRGSHYIELNSAHLSPVDRAEEFVGVTLRFLLASGA